MTWDGHHRNQRLDNVLKGKTLLTVAPSTKVTGPNGAPKKWGQHAGMPSGVIWPRQSSHSARWKKYCQKYIEDLQKDTLVSTRLGKVKEQYFGCSWQAMARGCANNETHAQPAKVSEPGARACCISITLGNVQEDCYEHCRTPSR